MSTFHHECEAQFVDAAPRGAPATGGSKRDIAGGLAMVLVAVGLAPLLMNLVAAIASFSLPRLEPSLPIAKLLSRVYFGPRLIRIAADVALVFGVWRFTRGATSLLPSWSRSTLRIVVAIASAASAAAAAIALTGVLDASAGLWTILTSTDLVCIALGASTAGLALRRLERRKAGAYAMVVASAASALLLVDVYDLASHAAASAAPLEEIATSVTGPRVLAGIALWAAFLTLIWKLRRSLANAAPSNLSIAD
jgi:hypothetical protein